MIQMKKIRENKNEFKNFPERKKMMQKKVKLKMCLFKVVQPRFLKDKNNLTASVNP